MRGVGAVDRGGAGGCGRDDTAFHNRLHKQTSAENLQIDVLS